MKLFPIPVTIIYGLIPLNLQLFHRNSSYSLTENLPKDVDHWSSSLTFFNVGNFKWSK